MKVTQSQVRIWSMYRTRCKLRGIQHLGLFQFVEQHPKARLVFEDSLIED